MTNTNLSVDSKILEQQRLTEEFIEQTKKSAKIIENSRKEIIKINNKCEILQDTLDKNVQIFQRVEYANYQKIAQGRKNVTKLKILVKQIEDIADNLAEISVKTDEYSDEVHTDFTNINKSFEILSISSEKAVKIVSDHVSSAIAKSIRNYSTAVGDYPAGGQNIFHFVQNLQNRKIDGLKFNDHRELMNFELNQNQFGFNLKIQGFETTPDAKHIRNVTLDRIVPLFNDFFAYLQNDIPIIQAAESDPKLAEDVFKIVVKSFHFDMEFKLWVFHYFDIYCLLQRLRNENLTSAGVTSSLNRADQREEFLSKYLFNLECLLNASQKIFPANILPHFINKLNQSVITDLDSLLMNVIDGMNDTEEFYRKEMISALKPTFKKIENTLMSIIKSIFLYISRVIPDVPPKDICIEVSDEIETFIKTLHSNLTKCLVLPSNDHKIILSNVEWPLSNPEKRIVITVYQTVQSRITEIAGKIRMPLVSIIEKERRSNTFLSSYLIPKYPLIASYNFLQDEIVENIKQILKAVKSSCDIEENLRNTYISRIQELFTIWENRIYVENVGKKLDFYQISSNIRTFATTFKFFKSCLDKLSKSNVRFDEIHEINSPNSIFWLICQSFLFNQMQIYEVIVFNTISSFILTDSSYLLTPEFNFQTNDFSNAVPETTEKYRREQLKKIISKLGLTWNKFNSQLLQRKSKMLWKKVLFAGRNDRKILYQNDLLLHVTEMLDQLVNALEWKHPSVFQGHSLAFTEILEFYTLTAISAQFFLEFYLKSMLELILYQTFKNRFDLFHLEQPVRLSTLFNFINICMGLMDRKNSMELHKMIEKSIPVNLGSANTKNACIRPKIALHETCKFCLYAAKQLASQQLVQIYLDVIRIGWENADIGLCAQYLNKEEVERSNINIYKTFEIFDLDHLNRSEEISIIESDKLFLPRTDRLSEVILIWAELIQSQESKIDFKDLSEIFSRVCEFMVSLLFQWICCLANLNLLYCFSDSKYLIVFFDMIEKIIELFVVKKFISAEIKNDIRLIKSFIHNMYNNQQANGIQTVNFLSELIFKGFISKEFFHYLPKLFNFNIDENYTHNVENIIQKNFEKSFVPINNKFLNFDPKKLKFSNFIDFFNYLSNIFFEIKSNTTGLNNFFDNYLYNINNNSPKEFFKDNETDNFSLTELDRESCLNMGNRNLLIHINRSMNERIRLGPFMSPSCWKVTPYFYFYQNLLAGKKVDNKFGFIISEIIINALVSSIPVWNDAKIKSILNFIHQPQNIISKDFATFNSYQRSDEKIAKLLRGESLSENDVFDENDKARIRQQMTAFVKVIASTIIDEVEEKKKKSNDKVKDDFFSKLFSGAKKILKQDESIFSLLEEKIEEIPLFVFDIPVIYSFFSVFVDKYKNMCNAYNINSQILDNIMML
eukprot:TRINITY_DN7186_c0_g1_i1.p1 TRINITY_DN7186_c0_g1~~TRINITY_DN7186_c0_g1_i1.p1  ORF type:complete len:1407 (+),score=409.16 TRINITY_DN7186_c0_g1_i1:83-4303(+)